MAKSDGGKAKPKGKGDDESVKIVARNRRARFEFDLLETVEAGIVLTGTEVKSLRNGKASLEEAYAGIDRAEVWLYGCDIPEYLQANRMNHKAKRPRKLLLHRSEIGKLFAKAVGAGPDPRPPEDLLQGRHRQGRDLRRPRAASSTTSARPSRSRTPRRDMDRALRGRG